MYAIRSYYERYFDGIVAAKHIDKLTLHYLDGKIRVELLLPLEVLHSVK